MITLEGVTKTYRMGKLEVAALQGIDLHVGRGEFVASRLEGMNKEFGTTILLSEETYRASGSNTPAEFIGEAAVRGRKRPVRVYAIGPRKEEPPVE